MEILVFNCGSSSIRAAVIDVAHERHTGPRTGPRTAPRTADIHLTGIGEARSRLLIDGREAPIEACPDHAHALDLLAGEIGPLAERIEGVGHRVVHGGERFTRPTLVDAAVTAAIAELSPLAPLHNPLGLAGIEAAQRWLPDLPQVAVFDTAFHATLPLHARVYALPRELTAAEGIRRYGFHGISHECVADRAAEFLNRPLEQLRLISCHLGNGSSMAAIDGGRSVETSMGMTPLEGLVMGSRSGDVDPGILIELQRRRGWSADDLDDLLNHRSGLLGMTGVNDMREIERRAGDGDGGDGAAAANDDGHGEGDGESDGVGAGAGADGDDRNTARLAIAVYTHRIRKYVGAYAAVMGGMDAIIFTGGIGQNSALVRRQVSRHLGFLGAELDADRNRDATVGADCPVVDVATTASRTRLLVVATDEEQLIARHAATVIAALAANSAINSADHPAANSPANLAANSVSTPAEGRATGVGADTSRGSAEDVTGRGETPPDARVPG